MTKNAKHFILVVVLLLVTCSLAFWSISSRTINLDITLIVEVSKESEPLHGQTLRIEGYVIDWPLLRTYFARGRVTVGGYVLRIDQFRLVENIMNIKDVYALSLTNAGLRQNPSEPALAHGSIVGNLRASWIETGVIVLLYPENNRTVSLRLFPAP